MTHRTFLAFPRLHPDLAQPSGQDAVPALPRPLLTLWPGLPHPPSDVWLPSYAWSPSQAAAVLRDLTDTAALGAGGAPVGVTGLEAWQRQPDLSPAEQRALEDFAGKAPASASPSVPSRHEQALRAQNVLLLAWLRESQFKELQNLERAISLQKRNLDSWLSDPDPEAAPLRESEEMAETRENFPLPAWPTLLNALWVFCAASPADSLALVVTEQAVARSMAATLPSISPEQASFNPAPAGYEEFSISEEHPGLSLSPQSPGYILPVLIPTAWLADKEPMA